MFGPPTPRGTTGEETAFNDYPLSEVPAKARRGVLPLIMILIGFVFFTPTMLSGARLGAAFRPSELLAVLVVGSLILGTYVAVLGVIGARTGLTTVLLARYTLGRAGAKWADILLGGTQVCWYAVTAAFLADLLASAFGWQEHTWLIIVVAASFTGVTAYFGYRGLEALSAVSVPLMLLLMGWVAAQAWREIDTAGGLDAVEPTSSLAWATAVTIVVGTFVSGGTQTPNWTRFARKPSHALMATFGAFFFANLMMLVFGAVGAIAYQEPDFVAVLLQLNLTVAAVVLLVFNIWTTQDNSAYSFGVAGAEMFGVNDKRPFIVGGVIVAVILALSGIYEALPQYLVLLGVFIPPLGGVIIGDYLFVWRGRLPRLDKTRFVRFRWDCLSAYALGTLVAWLSDRLSVGLPPVQGILTAFLAVPLFTWGLRRLGVRSMHTVRPEKDDEPGRPDDDVHGQPGDEAATMASAAGASEGRP
ncbi:cytosine permease [Phytoactinopolyspora alkaliphila]|uniref:Cytosine permease n=1 Tax=Phytoactinopolyspora alkaliphila TaxID=1783498 RepID=A0A6N9YSW2_9ACTN|nr:cytosine permease [Phytoactinopolyspora alkaliphila]NED97899.1 cytosine permease [Phytoactinopolyspora alkaliphila]